MAPVLAVFFRGGRSPSHTASCPKCCHEKCLGLKWTGPTAFISVFLFMCLLSWCRNEEKGAPPLSYSSLPQIKPALPTESLLHHYRRSLSCRLQFGPGMDVQQPNTPLGPFSGLNLDLRPCLPFTVSASFFFSSCVSLSVHYVRHMALTSVMQYDLFSLISC